MFNLYHSYKPVGTVVYYVKGARFTNTNSHLRDGKEKAKLYALQNSLSENDIIKFDSILECDRYEYLKELEKDKIISHLEHHKVIELIPSFINANGDTIPALTYNADFVYKRNKQVIVEDVKGASLFEDTRFETIKQVFDYKFKEQNIYLKIIIKRDNEFVEWHMGEVKKSRKLIKKQSDKNKKLKKDLHDKEIAEKKLKREKERYLELRKKSETEELSYAEKKRINELENILKNKGLLIEK